MKSKDKEDLDNINKIASLFKEYWNLYDQYHETRDQSLTSKIDDIVDEMGKCIYKLKFAFEDLDYFSKLDEESFKAEIDKKDVKELLDLNGGELDKAKDLEKGSNKFRYHRERYDITKERIIDILLKKD